MAEWLEDLKSHFFVILPSRVFQPLSAIISHYPSSPDTLCFSDCLVFQILMNVSSTPLNVNPTRCVKTKSARTIAVLKKICSFTKKIRAFVKGN